MPRTSGVYALPPGSTATTLTTISSSAYNTLIADIETDANTPRPVVAGGTGGATADAALTNLGAGTTGKAVFAAADQAAAQTAIGASGNLVPAGAVMHFAMSTAPTGWLAADGSAVSRTTYAALFAAIGTTYGTGNGSTTFNLPDFRGVFIRGVDNGKGLDAGRTFASYQGDAVVNHTHSGTTSSDAGHSHGYADWAGQGQGSGTGLNYSGGGSPWTLRSATTDNAGAHTHTFTTGNPNSGGAAETRVKNYALLACIKV